MKNIAVDMKSIAEKTKDVKDVTGFFKNKFSGKDAKEVLGAVAVRDLIHYATQPVDIGCMTV